MYLNAVVVVVVVTKIRCFIILKYGSVSIRHQRCMRDIVVSLKVAESLTTVLYYAKYP